ncbi:MAG: hypothetical protein DWQ42_03445 [Planctomycetota bacterium]|nr:MAG: hypothetical protein DWQ42_03445 [Planctomycetota bacterium]REK42298.1 MAG: hypothetical protein DWQ46_13870 [Planctomycetota bacterium]
MEGDLANAAISATAMIPVAGQAATGARLTYKFAQQGAEAALKHADTATDVLKHSDLATDAVSKVDAKAISGVKRVDDVDGTFKQVDISSSGDVTITATKAECPTCDVPNRPVKPGDKANYGDLKTQKRKHGET